MAEQKLTFNMRAVEAKTFIKEKPAASPAPAPFPERPQPGAAQTATKEGPK